MDKRFIIAEEELDFRERLSDFVKGTFGDQVLENVDIKVEAGTSEDSVDILWLEIHFREYKYTNRGGQEYVEYVGIALKFNGYQPFNIEGKWMTKVVYEFMQESSILKSEKIYGLDTGELYKMFIDRLLTC